MHDDGLTNLEPSSEQLKNSYLEKMLSNYRQKYEYFRKQNDQLTNLISDSKIQLTHKDNQITRMAQEI